MFKADLPGLKKEEVKVEIEEEGRVLQISGQFPRWMSRSPMSSPFRSLKAELCSQSIKIHVSQ